MITKFFWTAALFFIGVMSLNAQGDAPDQIEAALADLSERVGQPLTLEDLDAYEWRAERFGDSSLGCPEEGMSYMQVITEGYQFLIGYAGLTYDYRVANRNNAVVLCEVTEGTQVVPPPVATPASAVGISLDNLTTLVEVLQLGSDSAGVVAWASAGDFVASASTDEAGIWIYQVVDGTLSAFQRERLPLDNQVTALAFNSDSSLLAIGDEQGMLHFFNPASPTEVRSISAFDEAILGLAFSPDNQQLIVASASSVRVLGLPPTR